MSRLLQLFALSLAALPLTAWADPPGRAAQLSRVEGEVAVFADPALGWESGRINATLTSENSVWTEPGARAEVRFGSTALRLGEATQLDILRLDDEAFQAHLARGSLTIRVREIDRNETYSITTPQASFQLRGPGRYRIDAAFGRDESRLTVFAGNARLETSGGYIVVDTGRSVRVFGAARPQYAFENAHATDLDEWAFARDQRLDSLQARRYLPAQMTGWEELDEYGYWREEPELGAVWYPTRLEAGWAPYRYGRWSWVRPWGWTWVDDAPWGYAPFHYGRWVSINNRWGWYPGRYTGRPVWAPALVAWVGRPGWRIAISSGPTEVLGWYPLSPFERYQPWYSTNVTYVQNVNRIVIVRRSDRDRRGDRRDDRRDDRWDNRDRGATVVPRQHFGSPRSVHNYATPVASALVSAEPAAAGSVVLPSRDHWHGAPRPTEVGSAPAVGASGGAGGRPPRSVPFATGEESRDAGSRASVPSVPIYPAAPAAPTSRIERPAVAEPATRIVPADPVTVAKPVVPAPHLAKPMPADPVTVAKPVVPAPHLAKPMPVEGTMRAKPMETETRLQPAQPAFRVKPVENRGGVAPGSQPIENAMPRQVNPPAAATPPVVREKPSGLPQGPARPLEKPDGRRPESGDQG